jgi:hypothetical protein
VAGPSIQPPGRHRVTQASPRLVVLPRYQSGATLAVRRLPGADALLRLSACVFPSALPRRHILERLARLLRSAPCYELDHGGLPASVDAVHALLDAPERDPSEEGPPSEDRVAPKVAPPAPRTQDDDRRPAPRSDAAVLDVGDEWILHVAVTDEIHRVDALGVSLWERLDGRRSVGELIEELTAAAQPGDRENVSVKVRNFVADLEALQLVD